MKRTRKIISGSIFAAALVVVLLLLAKPVFNIDLSLVKDKTTATSTATLIRVRDILSLNTVEVVYKVVFPFDFVPAEMDWDLFLKQSRAGRILTVEEESYLQVYHLCEDIGIDLDGREREFVVLTTILKGGFDLSSNPVFHSPESAGELADEYISIDSENRISILLPQPVITDVIIEDANTESYTYPDIEIGPENWKKLTSFVKTMAAANAVNHGILDIASENGRQFLKRLFLDAGYSSVSFRE